MPQQTDLFDPRLREGLDGDWFAAQRLAHDLHTLAQTLRAHNRPDDYLVHRCEVLASYIDRVIKPLEVPVHDM